MKKYYIEIFILIVLIQIGIICLTLYRINQKLIQKKTLEQIRITEIRKIEIATSSGSLLKSYYEPNPGIINDETQWLKEKVKWTINTDSLNDRFDYTLKKPSDTYRIIALGDSWTYGDHINTKDSWPEKLEDILNKKKPCSTYKQYEVINLGLRGFDIQNEVERFKIRGKKYNPDLVLWMMINNDFVEIRELLEPIERVAQKITGENLDMGERPVNPQYFFLARKMFEQTYTTQTIQSLIRSHLSEFDTMYLGPLIVITFNKLVEESHMQFIKSLINIRPKSFVLSDMPNLEDSGKRLDDGHPSVAGHKDLADRIYKNLKTNPLFCK